MSDFDVSRIVPSTRDLFGAIATKRDGLALIAEVAGDDDEALAAEAARLAELDLRAFAMTDADHRARVVATHTTSTPLLLLAEMTGAEHCQHARFYGADGVACSAELAKTAQSMRMMALGIARSLAEAQAEVDAGARAVLLMASLEEALATGEALSQLLIAQVPGLDAAGARQLFGKVDAAVIPSALVQSEGFAALLEELDT